MKTKRYFYGWVVALCCTLLAFSVNAMGNNALSLYIAPISETLGVNRVSMNLALLTVGMFTRTVCGLFYGKLSDRFGIKPLMFTGCALLLLAYYLLYSATGILGIALGSGIYGITHSIGTLSAYNTIINNWFVKRKGLMLGLVNISIGIGGVVISPLIGGWIKNDGWNASLLYTGIIIGAVALPAIALIRVSPKSVGQLPYGAQQVAPDLLKEEPPAGKSSLLGLRQAARTGRFWMLIAIQIISGLSFGPAFSSVNPYFTALGAGGDYVYNVLMVMLNVGVIIGAVTSGMLYDKFGLRAMILFIGAVLGTGMALMTVPGIAQNRILPVIAVLCVGYGNSISLGTVTHYVNNVFGFGKTRFPAFFGLFFAVSNIGNMVSSPITGRIFDITGSYRLSYIISLCLLIVMLILASAVIGMGKRAAAADKA